MTKLIGKVTVQKFCEGSKSEHDVICLKTGDKIYRLKKRGGNPFFDEWLHKLVGKTIELEGNISSDFFVITDESEE